jgi:hypothetical protein
MTSSAIRHARAEKKAVAFQTSNKIISFLTSSSDIPGSATGRRSRRKRKRPVRSAGARILVASAFLPASSPVSRAAATETIIEKSGHRIPFISRHPKSIHTLSFLLVELFYSSHFLAMDISRAEKLTETPPK